MSDCEWRFVVPALWFAALIPAGVNACGSYPAPTPTPQSKPAAFRASITHDLDRDGRIERVAVDASREAVLSVWHGKRRAWSGVPKRWKPWKLALADVDGDGKQEIVLGVNKSTRYIKKPHNCLFVYGWDGRKVYPKWLSSSLSKPFTDFLFADLDKDGKADLVALETRRDGRQCVVVYSWIGFGYGFEWQSGDWNFARLAGTHGARVVVASAGRRYEVGKPAPG